MDAEAPSGYTFLGSGWNPPVSWKGTMNSWGKSPVLETTHSMATVHRAKEITKPWAQVHPILSLDHKQPGGHYSLVSTRPHFSRSTPGVDRAPPRAGLRAALRSSVPSSTCVVGTSTAPVQPQHPSDLAVSRSQTCMKGLSAQQGSISRIHKCSLRAAGDVWGPAVLIRSEGQCSGSRPGLRGWWAQ